MINSVIQQAMEEGKGILRLAPAWVPRSFCRPGRRLKLHPDDYYAYGLNRGAIDERWLASTTRAENGPLTNEDEGLSYVVTADGSARGLLKEGVSDLKGELIGRALYEKYGCWPAYSKFFDNQGPLPHHVHHDDAHAALVHQKGKPEMYFFPAQMNNHGGEFPFTFFGFNPGTTREEVRQALSNFPTGDNGLINLSRAYKLTVDTGWDVPPGVLHAPGSLCTYEPQFASDVFAMYQSVLYYDHVVGEDLLWKDCPADRMGDVNYLIEVLDWDLNVDPDFYKSRFMKPCPVKPMEEMTAEGYVEEWICYKSDKASAKRLTVLPGRTVAIKDAAAYGLILLQGHGKLGPWDIESPTMIRFGGLTNDEYFVSEGAAKEGVSIVNPSATDPIVMLKHFAENPERDLMFR